MPDKVNSMVEALSSVRAPIVLGVVPVTLFGGFVAFIIVSRHQHAPIDPYIDLLVGGLCVLIAASAPFLLRTNTVNRIILAIAQVLLTSVGLYYVRDALLGTELVL